MKLFSQTSTHRGFTLVELAVVILIIGILTAITVVSYNGAQIRAKEVAAQESMTNLARMAIKYKADTGAYPDLTSKFTDNYAVKFDKALFSDTVNFNLVYCGTTNNKDYALLAITKSGKRLFIVNNDAPKEYTGGVNWNTATSATTLCTSVLAGSASRNSPGYSKSVAPTGWQLWATGS